MRWKALIEQGFGGVTLRLGKSDTDGGVEEITHLEVRRRLAVHNPGPPLASGELAVELVQAILDEAWAHGFRPSSGLGKVDQDELTATQAHLADLRKIVFENGLNFEINPIKVNVRVDTNPPGAGGGMGGGGGGAA